MEIFLIALFVLQLVMVSIAVYLNREATRNWLESVARKRMLHTAATIRRIDEPEPQEAPVRKAA